MKGSIPKLIILVVAALSENLNPINYKSGAR